MLEFYYDFLDRYFDQGDFELIQMDTDSNYLAISADRLEDIVRQELCADIRGKKEAAAGLGQVKRSQARAV